MKYLALILLVVSATANASGKHKGPPPPVAISGAAAGAESIAASSANAYTGPVTNTVETNPFSDASSFNEMQASPSYDNETLAIALATTLGAAAIGDCIASRQWATPIFSQQKVKLNRWCAAESYDRKGLHETAARMRCQIKSIRKMFDTKDECIVANTMNSQPIVIEQLERIEEIESQIAQCDERADRVFEACQQKWNIESLQDLQDEVLAIERKARELRKSLNTLCEYYGHDWKFDGTGHHGSDKGDDFFTCRICGKTKKE